MLVRAASQLRCYSCCSASSSLFPFLPGAKLPTADGIWISGLVSVRCSFAVINNKSCSIISADYVTLFVPIVHERDAPFIPLTRCHAPASVPRLATDVLAQRVR